MVALAITAIVTVAAVKLLTILIQNTILAVTAVLANVDQNILTTLLVAAVALKLKMTNQINRAVDPMMLDAVIVMIVS